MNISVFARLYWPAILAGAAVLLILRLAFQLSPLREVVRSPRLPEQSPGARSHVVAISVALFISVTLAAGEYIWRSADLLAAVLRPLVFVCIGVAYMLGWSDAKGTMREGLVRTAFVFVAVVACAITIYLLRP